MAKKSLKSAVQENKRKKRPPGWHGNNRRLNNAERARLGLGPVDEVNPTSRKGVPNLKRDDSGNYVNQYGVVITPEEKRRFEVAVNKANRHRMKMLIEEGSLPRMSEGKDTGFTVKSLQAMGKESDFILARKSKSLQGFKDRESFERYWNNVELASTPEYLEKQTRLYKRNHMKAIANAYGDEAKDVLMKIRMMKPEEYRKLIQSEEMLEISYLYEPGARTARLNAIRRSLGMKLKEEPYEDLE